jgi:hypothetical protein
LNDGNQTYSWNYRNELVTATVGNKTITYAYDQGGQRIKVSSGTTFTLYPTKYYNIDETGRITKHIFGGGVVVATIEGTGVDAKVYTNHADYLNSVSVITDSAGQAVQVLDYFPYGNIRLDDKVSSFTEQRKYIGQE